MENEWEPKRKSFTVTTVLTFHTDKIVSKACFLLPSNQILDVVLPYSKSEWICIHINMENNLYIKHPWGLISSLQDIDLLFTAWRLIFWFSCHDFPFLSLSEQYT